MLKKLEVKGLKSVTEFRVIKQHINNAVKARRVALMSRRLREFTEQSDLTSEHLNIESAATSASARKVAKAASNLYSMIEEIDNDQYVGEEAMWSRLDELSRLIRQRLVSLGWRMDK